MKEKKTPDFIVVDDDPINNLVCTNVIKITQPGSEVETFTDPEICLRFIQSLHAGAGQPVSILFLDLNMPILTGWDFLNRFEKFPQKIRRRLKIFILSSSVDARDKQMAEASPLVLGFIEKPLTPQHVKSLHTQRG